MNLFEPIVPKERQHQHFRTLLRPDNRYVVDVLRGDLCEQRSPRAQRSNRLPNDHVFQHRNLQQTHRPHHLSRIFHIRRRRLMVTVRVTAHAKYLLSVARDRLPHHFPRAYRDCAFCP